MSRNWLFDSFCCCILMPDWKKNNIGGRTRWVIIFVIRRQSCASSRPPPRLITVWQRRAGEGVNFWDGQAFCGLSDGIRQTTCLLPLAAAAVSADRRISGRQIERSERRVCSRRYAFALRRAQIKMSVFICRQQHKTYMKPSNQGERKQ